MKKVALVLVSVVYSTFLFSQNKTSNTEFGFSLGMNYSNVLPKRSQIPPNQTFLNSVHETNNGYGFHLGILMEKRLGSHFLLSPRVNLSFNGGSLRSQHPDGTTETTYVSATTLEACPMVIIRPESTSRMPYFMLGPNVKMPLPEKNQSFDSKAEFAIDFGIGLNNTFKNFNFAPELSYSYGLSNLAYQADVDELYVHRISLTLNFRG